MVLVEDGVAFGLANLLEDDLLGQLGGNAAQSFNGFFLQQFTADDGVFADLERLFE